MKRIVLSGCNGKMGRVISHVVSDINDIEIIAGIDVNTASTDNYPIYSKPLDFDGQADVIIDFSHPSALSSILKLATTKKIPAVIATTGLSSTQIEELKEASKIVPIFFSANMSLGVNLVIELAKKAASILYGNFDIEIVEKHHNQKIDAPSGTAMMIADEISASLPIQPQYIFDRHSQRKKRDKNEIGIHAIRGGTIVGEHEIIFAGLDEIVEIKHSAMSKEIFATGAIRAAIYLSDQKAGFYNMSNIVAFD
jgi:4-hydroxy-tetrahydrodipicolinate reductase